MSIVSVMPSNHLILCCPLLLLPSVFPIIRVFTNEPVLCIRWPKYCSFNFSISPSNEYSGLIPLGIDWFGLLVVQVTLKSSPAPKFERIHCSHLYGPNLTSVHEYWENRSFDYQFSSVQFSSVQFSSVAQSCLTLCNPWTSAHQASLSLTNSQSSLKLISIELVMPSNHLILCHPLLLLPSIFLSIWVFLKTLFFSTRVFTSVGPSIGVSASTSVLPMNIHGILGVTGLISLQSMGLSRVFSNNTVQKHQFFGAQLSSQSNSHIHT